MAFGDPVIVSWDTHNINDDVNYRAGFRPGLDWGLPDVQAILARRTGRWPLVAGIARPGWRLQLEIVVVGADLRALRDQLLYWFDPEDETPKALVIEDSNSNELYVMAICEMLQPMMSEGLAADAAFVATLAVHNDVRWRKAGAETHQNDSIVASGGTWDVDNKGTDDAYPEIDIDPILAKTGSYLYRRWIPVIWRAGWPYTRYPTDICNDSFNTQALVTAVKMQALGEDLRVWVDGVEVDRWLDGINTTTTKVWVNLNFQAVQQATLAADIAGGGTVDTIDVNEPVNGFPSAGILLIGTEAFTYTAKNNSLRRFTGVIRAARGTSAGGHSAGAVVWWVQHDIWILYGNAAATAPSVDGNYEPAFELDHSVNTSWVYEEFGENDGLRPGQWTQATLFDSPYHYTANHATYADPWSEIGIRCLPTAWGRYKLWNPCGISDANFTNGEKYVEYLTASAFIVEICSSSDGVFWTLEYAVPLPGAASSWEAWSRNEALTVPSTFVALDVRNDLPSFLSYDCRAEAADVTLTFYAGYVPATSIGSEQGNYLLDCEIENTETGDKIRLAFTGDIGTMELHVNTDEKTVRNIGIGTGEDTNEFQALTLVDGPRRDWLRLVPGINTLRFTDAGTNGVNIYTHFEQRYY